MSATEKAFLIFTGLYWGGTLVLFAWVNWLEWEKISASAEEPEQKSAGADAPASQPKEDSDGNG